MKTEDNNQKVYCYNCLYYSFMGRGKNDEIVDICTHMPKQIDTPITQEAEFSNPNVKNKHNHCMFHTLKPISIEIVPRKPRLKTPWYKFWLM